MFSSCIFLLFLVKLFFSTRKGRKGQEGGGAARVYFGMFSSCTFLLFLVRISSIG